MHTTSQIVCIYMHKYSASGTPTYPLKLFCGKLKNPSLCVRRQKAFKTGDFLAH